MRVQSDDTAVVPNIHSPKFSKVTPLSIITSHFSIKSIAFVCNEAVNVGFSSVFFHLTS